jgi:hypothetical protein
VTVAHQSLSAVSKAPVGMRGEKVGHLGFDSLGKQRSRAVAQNLGQSIGEHPSLDELENVNVVTAYHSFAGEVEALTLQAVTNFREQQVYRLTLTASADKQHVIDLFVKESSYRLLRVPNRSTDRLRTRRYRY